MIVATLAYWIANRSVVDQSCWKVQPSSHTCPAPRSGRRRQGSPEATRGASLPLTPPTARGIADSRLPRSLEPRPARVGATSQRGNCWSRGASRFSAPGLLVFDASTVLAGEPVADGVPVVTVSAVGARDRPVVQFRRHFERVEQVEHDEAVEHGLEPALALGQFAARASAVTPRVSAMRATSEWTSPGCP